MKRTWVISFDGGLNAPWLARPERGAKVFFKSAEQLVRFLIDGGLDPVAIGIALRKVESGREATVELESRSTT